MNRFKPGDKVHLSNAFLKATGNSLGVIAAQNQTWTVRVCECLVCALDSDMVAVDQPSYEDALIPRHIHYANLEKVR